jgi:hypothetical protein
MQLEGKPVLGSDVPVNNRWQYGSNISRHLVLTASHSNQLSSLDPLIGQLVKYAAGLVRLLLLGFVLH